MLKDEYISIELDCSEQTKEKSTAWVIECQVRFFESDSGYGNDTYMELLFPGSYSPVIDIRYDTDYSRSMSDGQHILYALDYLMNHYIRKTITVNGVKAHIKVEG